MTARVLPMAPLLIATALFTYVTRAPLLLFLVAVGAVVALLVASRIAASPFAQRATLTFVAIVGALGAGDVFAGPRTHDPIGPTHVWGIVAATAIMLASARRFFRDPEGGDKPDFALLTTALVACGEKRVGPVYLGAVVLFVVAVIAVIRGARQGLGWSVVEKNAPRTMAGMLAIVGCLSAGGMFLLPRLARVMQRQFERYVLPREPAHTGFTDRLRTAAPDALLQSDELALRVYGPHVDYLRGRVYDTFERGAWASVGEKPVVTSSTHLGRDNGAGVTEVRPVSWEYSGRAHYFVPRGARHVGTSSGTAVVDAFGALRPGPDEPPTPISFEVGAADYPPAFPTELDLQTPEALKAPLLDIALEWTQGATTGAAKLAAIEQHLTHDFQYSLEPDTSPHEPRILHFLTHSRRGHCEYFASAMALLGRVVGVPTRVVGGFRVTEHNAIGGYDVVREKNAHAWVEGWVEGEGWRTFDPTPPTEANLSRRSRTMSALADVVAATWDRALEQLGRARLWHFGLVLGLAVALLTVVRAIRQRRERRKSPSKSDLAATPMPCFTELEAALARLGHPRPPAEPLERYAARLREANLDSAADVVLEYGALRYGGLGESAAIVQRAEACATELGAAPHVTGGAASRARHSYRAREDRPSRR